MMYGQMTAGSWIYIGTQGILQGTYETFRGAAKRYFNDTLSGTITVTAGLGGMGGAQPLAVKLAGGVSICVEVDESRIQRRLETRYLDRATDSLEKAIDWQQMRDKPTRQCRLACWEMRLIFCREWCRWDLRQTLLQIRRARTIQCGDISRLPKPTRI